ncbi:MAG TPA: hypothetical protein VGN12_12000 [Pirellulales bacterium]|jgi:hypothetical protein
MTVLHSGSTKKFAAGWEGIFTRRTTKGAATVKVAATTPAKKKTASQKPKTSKAVKRRAR